MFVDITWWMPTSLLVKNTTTTINWQVSRSVWLWGRKQLRNLTFGVYPLSLSLPFKKNHPCSIVLDFARGGAELFEDCV